MNVLPTHLGPSQLLLQAQSTGLQIHCLGGFACITVMHQWRASAIGAILEDTLPNQAFTRILLNVSRSRTCSSGTVVNGLSESIPDTFWQPYLMIDDQKDLAPWQSLVGLISLDQESSRKQLCANRESQCKRWNTLFGTNISPSL